MPRIPRDDQRGFFDPDRFGEVSTFIGCGGIVGCALPTIATMGIKKYVFWDDDRVELKNVGICPVFLEQHVGRLKVEVARDYLVSQGVDPDDIVIHTERFDGARHGDTLEGYVITGVDTMAARKDIWRAIKDNGLVTVLMDGRTGGEYYTLIVIDPFDDEQVKWYQDHQLYDDERAVDEPCAERQIAYPAVALGAHMAATYAKLQRNRWVPWMHQEDMGGMDPVFEHPRNPAHQ